MRTKNQRGTGRKLMQCQLYDPQRGYFDPAQGRKAPAKPRGQVR